MLKSNSLFLFSLLGLMIFGGYFVSSADAANANLYVSAENSQFDNYMAGPMVIEVVIIDSDISDTDEGKGEPDVTVQGKDLRMAQATDGNWYGYFADSDAAIAADATVGLAGFGLDFGQGCTASTGLAVTGVSLTDTVGYFMKNDDTGFNAGGLESCTGTLGAHDQHVIREHKTLNNNPDTGNGLGQIGLVADTWPFIQLYDLNPTGSVEVTYNKGGGAQSTTLTFDTVDQFANLESDRTVFPTGAQVHLTMTDVQLNIDPTDEDSWTWGTNPSNPTVFYQLFTENGATDADGTAGAVDLSTHLGTNDFMFEDNGFLIIDLDAQNTGTEILRIIDNDDSQTNGAATIDASTVSTDGGSIPAGNIPVTFTELSSNSGLFSNYDESDASNLAIASDASRGVSASIDYNETPKTVLIGFDFGTIDIQSIDDEWNSGEEILVRLVDGDANKNSRQDEDLDIFDPNVDLIPSLQTGTPFTLESLDSVEIAGISIDEIKVQKFSQRALLTLSDDIVLTDNAKMILTLNYTFNDLFESINDPSSFNGFNFFNYDIRSINKSYEFGSIPTFDIETTDGIRTSKLVDNTDVFQGFVNLENESGDGIFNMDGDSKVQIVFTFNVIGEVPAFPGGITQALIFPRIQQNSVLPIVSDFFSYGFKNDGIKSFDRISNQIIRIEMEETGDNTSTFDGSLEFVMLNQLNILDENTYSNLKPIADDPTFIVIEDLTDEDSPRVNYLDIGADGVSTQIADQEEAPSHSGVVSFNLNSYKIGDVVDVTLEDLDLNTDSDLIDIYTVVVDVNDDVFDQVGEVNLPTDLSFGDLGRLLDITYDDDLWTTPSINTCDSIGDGSGTYLENLVSDTGLGLTGFTLVETDIDSGVFVGDFSIPIAYCPPNSTQIKNTPGVDVEVNYVDFRDASGEIIKVGDSAGVRSNTGSISLDRNQYPIPFGSVDDFFPGEIQSDDVTTNGDSIFPVHQTGVISDNDQNVDGATEEIGPKDLISYVRVIDPDFDIAFNVIDKIALGTHGPIKIFVQRGSEILLLATAGGELPIDGVITHGTEVIPGVTRELGPIFEIYPDSSIFEISIPVRYTDGPENILCPVTPDAGFKSLNGISGELGRFDESATSGSYCILNDDVLIAEYTDPFDASGEVNIVNDSAEFTMFTGVLIADKSIYVQGGDMILTIIDLDLNLDGDSAENYDLDLIEWSSDTATLTVGDLGGQIDSFDPEPLYFRETGDNTGIFQVVLEIPQYIGSILVPEGESITFEYDDWSPASATYVGEVSEIESLTIHTHDFSIDVATDFSKYVIGQTLNISGTVSPLTTFQPIVLTILNPNGDLTAASQISPQSDGTFSEQFLISGPLFDEFGSYTVNTIHRTASASASFDVGNGFVFSTSPDFSTDDRTFEQIDLIHFLAFDDEININDMKKMEFKLQDSKKNKLQGKLDLNPDGSFTSLVSLASLEPGTVKVEIKLEDKSKNKFNVKENIILTGDSTNPKLPDKEFYLFSKNSDFSTFDTEFLAGDTLYVLISSDNVDSTNMKKSEYKVEDSKKLKLKGNLVLGLDGNFTSAISLEDLNTGNVKVELKLEDKNRNKFQIKENIRIS